MNSCDSTDEFSPLVEKGSPMVSKDNLSKLSRTHGKDSGKCSKNGPANEIKQREITPNSSQNNEESSALIVPTQSQLPWVRLASFDHFDEDSLKSPESGQVSSLFSDQSTPSSCPDYKEMRVLPPEVSKASSLPVDDDDNEDDPPPSYKPPPSYNIVADVSSPGTPSSNLKGTENTSTPTKLIFLNPGRRASQTSRLRLRAAARTVQATVRLSRLEKARRRAKWAGKKFLVFLVSHVGLTVAVLLYAMAGGFLFRWLEVDAEVQRRQDMMDLRHRYLDQMWNETERLNVFYRQNWTHNVKEILMDFERRVYKSISDGTWDGAGDEVINKWTIAGSLLFSTTVITSIGYGDITPRTVAGKLVCIPFAIVGIPLTLLCLANLGQLMAVAFKFLWRRMLECRNIFRYCNAKGKTKDGKDTGVPDDLDETHIPITVCAVIIIAYTLGGAAIFSSWETGWTFLDGFYFSFITLSTIGFGDFVPGQYESGSNERRVVCTLYLMAGLALLAMVFQLMIDDFRQITRRYAEIFGLTEEQIEKDVEGLDSPIRVQEVVPHQPDAVYIIGPEGQDREKRNDGNNGSAVCVDPKLVIVVTPDVTGQRSDEDSEGGRFHRGNSLDDCIGLAGCFFEDEMQSATAGTDSIAGDKEHQQEATETTDSNPDGEIVNKDSNKDDDEQCSHPAHDENKTPVEENQYENIKGIDNSTYVPGEDSTPTSPITSRMPFNSSHEVVGDEETKSNINQDDSNCQNSNFNTVHQEEKGHSDR